MTSKNRQFALQRFLQQHALDASHCVPLSGDASFRHYYRISQQSQHWILMDAPPKLENCAPFMTVAKAFSQLRIQVPDIIAADPEHGFILLSDFGDQLLLNHLSSENFEAYYLKAMQTIQKIQQYSASMPALPPFDASHIQLELSRFEDWYIHRHLKMKLTPEQKNLWQTICDFLIAAITKMPQTAIHRDFHSRNIMLLPDDSLGILDFQDAMVGPIAYDLISLLHDCYIDWPQQRITALKQQFLTRFLNNNYDADRFLADCAVTATQRHLKCIGIFARLAHRDNKPDYLQDLPRLFGYLKTQCKAVPELRPLESLLTSLRVPLYQSHSNMRI